VIDEAAVESARILVVDDQAPNVTLLERLLDVSGFGNVVSTTDSSRVLGLCAEAEPDLILLDLQMPAPDGFEVMTQLAPWIHGPTRLPILVLTADTTREAKQRALSLGATDFLSKPFDTTEVVLRIRNLLTTRLLQLELRGQNRLLDRRVRARTRDLEEARFEIADRLALAAEYRDDTTGEHTRRVGRAAAIVAREFGLEDELVELLRRAAPLHDVGKLAIADSILLKHGPLTPVEYEVMKVHATVGSEILGRSRSRLLQVAEEIALTHHERWDGSGYPAGLKGEAIPISGRIVAIVDVFDALTHRRPYKEAWTVGDAVGEIIRLGGSHFDPQLTAVFAAIDPELLLSRARNLDLVA
jgi:putative two-component system response regulator